MQLVLIHTREFASNLATPTLIAEIGVSLSFKARPRKGIVRTTGQTP
jgi:hypothetical protein